jgi:hypothetical protein
MAGKSMSDNSIMHSGTGKIFLTLPDLEKQFGFIAYREFGFLTLRSGI